MSHSPLFGLFPVVLCLFHVVVMEALPFWSRSGCSQCSRLEGRNRGNRGNCVNREHGEPREPLELIAGVWEQTGNMDWEHWEHTSRKLTVPPFQMAPLAFPITNPAPRPQAPRNADLVGLSPLRLGFVDAALEDF